MPIICAFLIRILVKIHLIKHKRKEDKKLKKSIDIKILKKKKERKEEKRSSEHWHRMSTWNIIDSFYLSDESNNSMYIVFALG